MPELYDHVRTPKTPRWDGKLVASIAICVAVAVAVLTPVAQMLYYEKQFRGFIAELSESTVYAYRQNTLQVTRDGVTEIGEGEWGYTLFGCISRAGVGKPRKELPEEEPIELNYGNGATLQLWEVPIPERGARNPKGVLVHYVGVDGVAYTYDSDKLQFYEVVNSLH